MAVTIILICLAIQRWLPIDHDIRSHNWFIHYYQWLKDRFSENEWWSGWFGLFIIIAPALIIYILLAGLIYYLLGIIGYYLLALLVLWYALEARSLTAANVGNQQVQQILSSAYERIFALIFWLLILGSTGVVLYSLIVYLCRLLEKMTEDNKGAKLLSCALTLQGILDWVPLRLLGVTYALVGQFTPTFANWYKNLFTDVHAGREQNALCGLLSLGLETNLKQSPTREQLGLIEGLINRSLWVWLVVIALFTIGRWVG